jgi:hypothetical protein
VSLEVATSEPPATIVFVLDVEHDRSAGGLGSLVDRNRIGDDQISALCLSAAERLSCGYATQMLGTAILWNRCGDTTALEG